MGRTANVCGHWLTMVVLCVSVVGASGCLRSIESRSCSPEESDNCFADQVCWRGTCTDEDDVPEIDGGTDSGADGSDGVDDAIVGDTHGDAQCSNCEFGVRFLDLPKDTVTSPVDVRVEVVGEAQLVERVELHIIEGNGGVKRTMAMDAVDARTWEVEWTPTGPKGEQPIEAVARTGGGTQVAVRASIIKDCSPAKTMYPDHDGDGYGDSTSQGEEQLVCGDVYGAGPGERRVSNNDDCRDAYATVHPGAEMRCDGFDNNCDDTGGEPNWCAIRPQAAEGLREVRDVAVYADSSTCRVAAVGTAEAPSGMGGSNEKTKGWLAVYDCSSLQSPSKPHELMQIGNHAFFGQGNINEPVAVDWESEDKLHIASNSTDDGGDNSYDNFFVSYYLETEFNSSLHLTAQQKLHLSGEYAFKDLDCREKECVIVGNGTAQKSDEAVDSIGVDWFDLQYALKNGKPIPAISGRRRRMFQAKGKQQVSAVVFNPKVDGEDGRIWIGGDIDGSGSLWGVTPKGGRMGMLAPLDKVSNPNQIEPAEEEIQTIDTSGPDRVTDVHVHRDGDEASLIYTGEYGGMVSGLPPHRGATDIFVSKMPLEEPYETAWTCGFGSNEEDSVAKLGVNMEGRVGVVGRTRGGFEGKPYSQKTTVVAGFVRSFSEASECPESAPSGPTVLYQEKLRTHLTAVEMIPDSDLAVVSGVDGVSQDGMSGFLRLFHVTPGQAGSD